MKSNTNPDQACRSGVLPSILTIGLLVMSACVFLPGVEFRERYVLTTIPLGLLLIGLGSFGQSTPLKCVEGRFVLTFAIMFCYSLSATARWQIAALEARYPWLLPWSTLVLLTLVIICAVAFASVKRGSESLGEMWRPVLWGSGLVVVLGLGIKVAIARMATSNEIYRTPDWLEPQFRYFHLVYRSIEYGLLALLSFSVPERAVRPLGFGIAAVLLVKTAMALMLRQG